MINVTEWLDIAANRFPDKIAIEDTQQSLTYVELRTHSMALASRLVQEGLFKKPIAVLVEKSVDTLIAFFAVAYSGNFYTVIDGDMPVERIQKIFDIFSPEMIVTNHKSDGIATQFKEFNFLYLEDASDEGDTEAVYMQRRRCIDTDLLYVLFTSGSTGVPKGVTICHRSVIDYIDWVSDEFHITEQDKFGNQAPFYFDNSVLDIYTSIKTGATLNIIPQKLFSQPVKLLNYLLDKQVTTVFWVPSALIIVANLHALKKVNLDGKLKKILFCGEVMPTKQLNEWRKYVPNALYANLYGPTEITDACTFYIVDREFRADESLPIGKPMRNTEILVLNEQNQLVKNQEIGELCVRGVSLSMGYYGSPEKTKAAFVQNPLNNAYPELIYRTGDLVHYNEYGELIYDARKDFQIKYMGHRIELGEIETATSGIEGIERCCCIYNDEKKRIVLYYEGVSEKAFIEEQLSQLLPEYMIPSRYIRMEKLPLNANGKIDRKKLGSYENVGF